MDRNMGDEIVIPLSKSKITLLLFSAFTFVAGSVWIWFIADTQPEFNPLFVKSSAVAGVSFFGLCAIYGCFKLFDSLPGLIINSQGIMDNSSAVAAGQIHWNEITGLKTFEIAGQRFIVIEVLNPDRFIGNGGFFRRKLNATNAKLTGSPINISSNSLCMSFDSLFHELTKAYERYKGPG